MAWVAKCTNEECAELGIGKAPLGDDPAPEEVICGTCQEPCEIETS
jgi:hypothetical protein